MYNVQIKKNNPSIRFGTHRKRSPQRRRNERENTEEEKNFNMHNKTIFPFSFNIKFFLFVPRHSFIPYPNVGKHPIPFSLFSFNAIKIYFTKNMILLNILLSFFFPCPFHSIKYSPQLKNKIFFCV